MSTDNEFKLSRTTAAACYLIATLGILLWVLSTYGYGENDVSDAAVVCLIITAILFFIILIYSFVMEEKADLFPDDETDEHNINSAFATSDVSESMTEGGCDISEGYFNLCLEQSANIFSFMKRLNRDDELVSFINSIRGLESADGIAPENELNINPRIFFFVVYDFLKVYTQLGHEIEEDSKELLTLALFMNRVLETEHLLEYTNVSLMYSNTMGSLVGFLNVIDAAEDPQMTGRYDFYIPRMLETYGETERIQPYKILLYRYASLVAKADNEVTSEEADYLTGLMAERAPATSAGQVEKEPEENPSPNTLSPMDADPTEELNSLIGLDNVKHSVTRLADFVRIQNMRKAEGLRTSPISYHCVFTGNPGTGKTTVARIIAKIYRDLGVLTKGHLIETDRSGLVAEYVGQTAVKTNKIVDSALDGVLFVDEAYSLVTGGNNDYGMEAIATLLKRMEDNRDRLVVILAGYGNEMKQFIDSNPGLQSRFNRYFHFEDYTAPELVEIYKCNVSINDYIITPETEQKLISVIEQAVASKDSNFGNARYVRNLFEKTLENQATRLASQATITKDLLQEIIPDDVPDRL